MNDVIMDLDRTDEDILINQFSDAELEAAAATNIAAAPGVTLILLTESFRCCSFGADVRNRRAD